MSEDRTTQMLNYLSAISREVGEFRQEFNQFRNETNERLDRIERRFGGLEDQFTVFKVEQRQAERHLLYILEAGVTTRERVDDLQSRVMSLEGKGP